MKVLPQICDGFELNAYYRPRLPYRFFSMALERFDSIRRQQGNYRMRQYGVPLDVINSVIAGYDTFKYQLQIIPGTYVWGFSFKFLTQGALITDVNITVQDHDSGIDFFSDPVNGGIGNLVTIGVGSIPLLLSEPRLVVGSGNLDVTLVNRTGSNRQCQLLFWCAEPCVLVSEGR
ncbi:MAG: hypothetical protein U0Q18_25310 [Bryobacteraceae bacterium]